MFGSPDLTQTALAGVNYCRRLASAALSMKAALPVLAAACMGFALNSCSDANPDNGVVISVKDQRMLLIKEGRPVKSYPVSTSKFGLGDRRGSNCTPIGRMEVAKKIGNGAPSGAVFKSRQRTGEILPPNAPGRDPIVSRILWLRGKQDSTRNAFSRYIYIHGTPEEYTIGQPRSYGCIRMKSNDVIDLYKKLGVGSEVHVIKGPLVNTHAGKDYFASQTKYLPAAGS